LTDTAIRHADLKHMLTTRRDAVQNDVQSRIRDGRTARPADVGDDLDESDAGVQGEIAFALLQMRAEMLAGIEAALLRLDAGQYGFCLECGGEIAARRLHALPFAVRCQACEERREQEQGRARQFARRGSGVPIFSDAVGY
jgi:DnaK suppressor protein